MKHHYCSPSFWQGVRRISALLVFMLFTFVFVVSPIKVKAEAFPIPPVWLPMNPYNAQGLEGNYVLLTDAQKEIVKEIIGAVNVVNLGFGQYVLTNPVIGIPATRQFLRDYGGTFLETFLTQIMGTSRAMTDFVGSTIYKASTYNTLEEYEADTEPSVATGSQKYFQISPELTVAFKNWYRANGGVENWQQHSAPWSSNFVWATYNMSSSRQLQYNTYLAEMGDTQIANPGYNYLFNIRTSAFEKYNLFINADNMTAYFVDSSGNRLQDVYKDVLVYDTYTYDPAVTFQSLLFSFGALSWSGYSFSTIKELAQKIIAGPARPSYYSSSLCSARYTYSLYTSVTPRISDLVNHVYYGLSWQSKEEVYNIDDLNIGSTPSAYIDNISDTGYVDINTLIGQIADEVVNLREVVEESVFVKDNDSAIPYADSLQVAIDKYINQPESGVVIPSDIFGGLTGANGPVSYLWFMTKPLVSYTGDLLGLLTLEGDGTFQFTGLGYIVIGVVTIGIIGGLVTKCLL